MKQKQQLTPDEYSINQRKTKINVNIFFWKSPFCSQGTVFCVLEHSVKGTASVLPQPWFFHENLA